MYNKSEGNSEYITWQRYKMEHDPYPYVFGRLNLAWDDASEYQLITVLSVT